MLWIIQDYCFCSVLSVFFNQEGLTIYPVMREKKDGDEDAVDDDDDSNRFSHHC